MLLSETVSLQITGVALTEFQNLFWRATEFQNLFWRATCTWLFNSKPHKLELPSQMSYNE